MEKTQNFVQFNHENTVLKAIKKLIGKSEDTIVCKNNSRDFIKISGNYSGQSELFYSLFKITQHTRRRQKQM